MAVERSSIKKKIQRTRIRDYTFTIAFFFVTSFFIIFVIRPNLTVAFSLQEELETLRKLDNQYADYIDHVNDLTTSRRANRTRLELLDQSLPPSADINQVITTIRDAAEESGMLVNTIHFDELDLANNRPNQNQSAVQSDVRRTSAVRRYSITLNANADFNTTREFTTILLQQRRLKNINRLTFYKDEDAGTASANLIVSMEIEQYYL